MNKYKICVYAICKNEEKFVERWVQSMSEADLIVVTDTGSDDKTVDKLRNLGVTVYADNVEPWRFDRARNISLEHVPEDADICVCTDLDEAFEPGWRKKLESAWTEDAKQARYVYNWSLREDGSPDVQIYYSKIHSRKDFRWNYPIHEWLCYTGKEPKKTVFVEGMVLNHYPDSSKSRKSYLKLLELAVDENPQCDRMTYYLGREYMYNGQWQQCIDTLKRHLGLPSAKWKQERCASMRWIAKSYYELANVKECYSWYFRAFAEADMREPYIECAKIAYLLKDWPMVFFVVEEALKIKEKSKTYVNMGYSWDHTPYDLGAIACYRLGMYNKSQKYAQQAVMLKPGDNRLKKNLMLINEKLSVNSKKSSTEENSRKLIHTMLVLLREGSLAEDLFMLSTCLKSMEKSTYRTVIIYNQGCYTNEKLGECLSEYDLEIQIIGKGKNAGIPAGRQACFEYIWEKYPDTKFISETHMDMYFCEGWEEPLVEYLESHDEPVICSGIVDRRGIVEGLGKKATLPKDYSDYGEFLLALREDRLLHGFTHPCVHSSEILKLVGGYDCSFLTGKQCFEDDSLLLGYFYYYGTRMKWYPKINLNSVSYHAVAAQRRSLNDSILINYNGLVRQYGAMGLRHLCEIHKSQWHKNFFGDGYKEIAERRHM